MTWSWSTFWGMLFDGNFLEAAWTTIWLTVTAESAALILALVVALGLLSTNRVLVVVANFYVWVWRGTPLLVQLLILYFGLPQFGIRPSVIEAGLIGLAFNEAAYLSVLLKTNVLSVPIGQSDAGRVLGMRRWQRIRLVILPQAIRTFVPALGNQVNSMIKTTSLLSIISVQELLAYTRSVVALTYQPFEAFAVAILYYLAISALWNLFQRFIERRLNRASNIRPSLSRRPAAENSQGAV